MPFQAEVYIVRGGNVNWARDVSSVLREQFFVRPRKQGQSTPLTLWDSPVFAGAVAIPARLNSGEGRES